MMMMMTAIFAHYNEKIKFIWGNKKSWKSQQNNFNLSILILYVFVKKCTLTLLLPEELSPKMKRVASTADKLKVASAARPASKSVSRTTFYHDDTQTHGRERWSKFRPHSW